MIRFIEGQSATIKVTVSSSIDTTGFSVSLIIGAETKSISSIKDGGTYFVEFSASDIEEVPQEPIYGTIQVLDSNGDLYQKMLVEVMKVGTETQTLQQTSDTLPIVIAANWVGKTST